MMTMQVRPLELFKSTRQSSQVSVCTDDRSEQLRLQAGQFVNTTMMSTNGCLSNSISDMTPQQKIFIRDENKSDTTRTSQARQSANPAGISPLIMPKQNVNLGKNNIVYRQSGQCSTRLQNKFVLQQAHTLQRQLTELLHSSELVDRQKLEAQTLMAQLTRILEMIDAADNG